MKITFLFQFLVSTAFVVSLPENSTRDFSVGQQVHTSSGLLIGKPASQRTAVSEYLGIPFAQSPVGSLRFAAPQPYTSSGVVYATSYVSITLPIGPKFANTKLPPVVAVRDPDRCLSKRSSLLILLVTVPQIHKVAPRLHPGLQIQAHYGYLQLLRKPVINSVKTV